MHYNSQFVKVVKRLLLELEQCHGLLKYIELGQLKREEEKADKK
jgi:hypothetical protein